MLSPDKETGHPRKSYLIQNRLEETLLPIFEDLLFRIAILAQVGTLDPSAVDGNVGGTRGHDLVVDLEEVRVERISWKSKQLKHLLEGTQII